ncbi:MAG: lipid kinase [Desulfobacca sp.]|nr:lipid kinase [Desulfobacca sp.]
MISEFHSEDNPVWVMIVNPASANGSTGRRWSRNKPMLEKELPSFEAWQTTHPGHACELAQKALGLGYTTIAVHGGDGTINEVINGLLSKNESEFQLALLPNGTGADLVRTLGISHGLQKAARQARCGSGNRLDIGQVHFVDLEGKPAQRYFINVTDVGFGGDLVRYVNSHSKWLGGKLSFLQGLLVTLFRYRNKRIYLAIDGQEKFEVRASSIVVANGQYFGGGMWVAPEARLNDGIFEVVIVGDVSKMDVLANIKRLYQGTLAEHPKVNISKAKTIELTSDEEVLIDLDGELVGRLPARFQILPQKLSVIY